MRRRVSLVCAVLVSAALLVGLEGLWQPARGQSRGSLERRKRATETKKKQVQSQLRTTKSHQRKLVHQLNSARAELRQAQARLSRAEAQLDATRDKLRDVRRRHKETKEALEAQNEAFGSRLTALYKAGPSTYLAVVLGAEDFADFSTRAYYAQAIIESDAATLESIDQKRRLLAVQQAELEAREHEEAVLRTKVQQEKNEVAARTNAVASAKAQVDQQRKALEGQLAQLEAEARAITRMLRARGASQRYGRKWSGSFLKPCSGAITSYFGRRIHPILKHPRMHYGVDISAGYGTPIKAADTGLVIFAGRRGGYGNTVMIDHGSGMVTVYAHIRSGGIAVRAGQTVKRGQVIACVGSTGLSTGPHLHFEVRKNGSAVNPLKY